MGLTDAPTIPPPPPNSSAETVYLAERIGDLRKDINDEFGKLYAALTQERTDTRQLVNSVLEQYQKLIPSIEARVAKLKKIIEDGLDIDIVFDNGHG